MINLEHLELLLLIKEAGKSKLSFWGKLSGKAAELGEKTAEGFLRKFKFAPNLNKYKYILGATGLAGSGYLVHKAYERHMLNKRLGQLANAIASSNISRRKKHK